MRLNKFIYGSAIIAASLATTGCDNWLDVNHDPNFPSEVPMEQLLPGIVVGAAYNGMAWDCMFNCGVYNQYFTQSQGASQFKQTERFTNEEFSGMYRVYFGSVLGEAKALKAGMGENSNYSMIAELVSIFAWQNIVDIWGDVPYTEALDAQIIEPHFDNDEDIYKDLIVRIDKVIENISNGYYEGNIYPSYDFIFGGDVSKWALFANSLKLKIMHRLSNTSMYNNAELLSFIEKSEFLSENAELKSNIWQNKVTKMYPADEFENGNYFSQNVSASRSIVEYMINDPRLEKIFTKVDGAFVGKLQGDYNTTETTSKVSLATIVKNIPMISTWEVNFDIAEVYLLAGDSEKAQEYYEAAIAESFAYWGLAGKEADVIEGYASWTEDDDINFKNICLQRWAAFLMTQHGEAFFEINRTGYPELSTADKETLKTKFPVGMLTEPICGTVTAGKRPKSLLIPLDLVQALNSNAPKRPVDMTTKLFWQK